MPTASPTASWNTKYGRRRVRHEPPTLEEALTAAEGLTDEVEQQVVLAAELMQLPLDQIRQEAERILRQRSGRTEIQVSSGPRAGAAVVVERKPARRLVAMPAGRAPVLPLRRTTR